MRRRGRANWLVVLGLIGVVVIVVLFLIGGRSATSVAAEFMSALGKHDVAKLTELSYMDGDTPEQVRKKWEYTTQVAAPYYRFKWQFLGESSAAPDTSAVRLWVWRDAQSPASYEEKFEIPMVKVDGKWKVDVRGLNRLMYPGLPR